MLTVTHPRTTRTIEPVRVRGPTEQSFFPGGTGSSARKVGRFALRISIGALSAYYLVQRTAPVKNDRGLTGSFRAGSDFWPCQKRVVPYGLDRNRKHP